MIRVDKTLAELAEIVGGKVVGDNDIVIKSFSGIKEAKEGDLTFLANPKYLSLAKETKASAVLVDKNHALAEKAHVIVDNPSYSFSVLIKTILQEQNYRPSGVHPSAVVSADAKLGKNVSIGPHVVIEAKAVIGDHTVIMAGCFIGHETSIGSNALIYPRVTIRERIKIGERVIIHSGTVIGSDGFGFDLVGGVNEKIPQIGTVVVEDDVEIGANVTIDRARFDQTVIGQATKIDNLVQIAHNVIIGKNCIIVAQSGIAGSVVLKDGVVMAGQSGVIGHLTVGEGSVVAGKSVLTNDLPPHSKVMGFPAVDHLLAKRMHLSLMKLPSYIKKIQQLTKRLEKLEENIKDV